MASTADKPSKKPAVKGKAPAKVAAKEPAKPRVSRQRSPTHAAIDAPTRVRVFGYPKESRAFSRGNLVGISSILEGLDKGLRSRAPAPPASMTRRDTTRLGSHSKTTTRPSGRREPATRVSERSQAQRPCAAAEQPAHHAASAVLLGVRHLPRYVERLVLVQVGVVLEARDHVVSTVNAVVELSTSRVRAERRLKQLERRGAVARTHARRRLRRARFGVQRTRRETLRDAERRRKRLRKQVAANRERIQRELRRAEHEAERRREGVHDGVGARRLVLRAGTALRGTPARREAGAGGVAAAGERSASTSRRGETAAGSVFALRSR